MCLEYSKSSGNFIHYYFSCCLKDKIRNVTLIHDHGKNNEIRNILGKSLYTGYFYYPKYYHK